MATTGVDFVLIKKPTTPQLSGTAVLTPPFVQALSAPAALQVAGAVPGGVNTKVIGINNGNFLVDGFSAQGFAKNGAFHVTTSGTTAVTISLLNLATNSTSQAGDSVFAAWNKLKFFNAGTGSMTVGPGASNGAPILGGTTPTMTIEPGTYAELTDVAGIAIGATTTNITLTPSAGGDFVLGVGGS